MVSQMREERQPLLRSHSSVHGTAAPLGQSNLFQTVFNSTNVLLGVGLLSLPLGVKHAGWLVGIALLVFAALTTAYTAKVLARCLDTDKTLATYSDIAYASYGPKACSATRVLFSFIMIAACVALVILFGDTMNLLVPSLTVTQWKIVCGVLLVPLHFVPFSLLSFASVIGVAASLGLVLMTILAGIIKHDSPGSLRRPASTSLFPESWTTLPLSFGLIMSPWGGHASFPNLYRDMKNPKAYNHVLLYTFSSTFVIDASMAICGFLMYGGDTMDEIVANILVTPGQPHALLVIIIGLVAVMPVTKVPLSSRPLVIMLEGAMGLDPDHISSSSRFRNDFGEFTIGLHLARSALRLAVVLTIVLLSVLCPNFDSVMGFAGSALCFTICIILPLLFYVKLFEGRLSKVERIIDWILIVAATVMAVMGTVWAVIPKDSLPDPMLVV